jgi:hypothetical protein
MPWVGFEPTIQASERTKIVHAQDRSATVTGFREYYYMNIIWDIKIIPHLFHIQFIARSQRNVA